ncbi:hypothetical protein GE061_000540 [Apolygus lucorum]|uniref:Uncharacterized protein n=1 Tax=Apolygus lucorum TaxID=248454 RepID=A0A6A4KHE5_APOLU|nr:hypothetical protein GE061_000540 [Apolygus lucorum]
MLFVLLLCTVPLVHQVYSDIYRPCDLAQLLYANLEAHGATVVNQIPLLVCVAGYHQFDTDYKAGAYIIENNHIDEWNTTVSVLLYDFKGLFGLSRRDYLRLEEGNSSVPNEALYFLKQVIHLNHSPMPLHPTHVFFNKICSGEYVKNVSCKLNDYVQFGFEIPVPLRHDINDLEPRKPDEPKPTTAENSATIDTNHLHVSCEKYKGNSGIFSETIGYVIESLIFWTIGAIFYTFRPMCVEGIL